MQADTESKVMGYLKGARGGLLAFLCLDNIPDLIRCPAIADGKSGFCVDDMSAVATILLASGSSSAAHSIFKPCCCQGAARGELLFAGANIASMRNSK